MVGPPAAVRLSPPMLRAGVSCLALAAARSSLTGVSFNVCHFNKLGGRHPPTAVVWEGALARCGEGRGPAPNTGFRSNRPTKTMPKSCMFHM